MRCPKHGYEYEFLLGKCPYCEANELAERAKNDANDSARKALEFAERAAREQRESEQERRYEAEGRALDRELQAQRDERERENAEAEERLEKEQEREWNRKSEAVDRHLASCKQNLRKGGYGYESAVGDAKRALLEDKNSDAALEAAYEATEARNEWLRTSSLLTVPPNEYADRVVKRHIRDIRCGRYSTWDTDKLIMAVAKYGADGEQSLLDLVKAYTGGSDKLRAVLSKIDRLGLYDLWNQSRQLENATASITKANAGGALTSASDSSPHSPKASGSAPITAANAESGQSPARDSSLRSTKARGSALVKYGRAAAFFTVIVILGAVSHMCTFPG